MDFSRLHAVRFKDLEEEREFWKPLRSSETPRSMADLLGPYYVYSATGHVLNKLFRLKKPLLDHELQKVALDDEKNELFLMEPADIVYVLKEESFAE